ncbi:MAG: hypothetical protein R2865_15665 [Deinococcales bacterium]
MANREARIAELEDLTAEQANLTTELNGLRAQLVNQLEANGSLNNQLSQLQLDLNSANLRADQGGG